MFVSTVSFFIIVALYLDGYNGSVLLLTIIPISSIAFILLNSYVLCRYEHTIYNDYTVYETQKDGYYGIVTRDGVYVVNKSTVEFVPNKTKQVIVTKYKPRFEDLSLNNNRIKKVEISI